MKLQKFIYSMMMGTAVLTGATGCVSDLDQYPQTETTSKNVYTTLANYEAVLGKIYAAMVTSGQGKGGDNKDMESVLNEGSGFDYMRMFWNLQECGTDETTGYLSQKWSNKTDDGETASNTTDAGVETDYPLFRLADVYLMYAECVARIKGTDWDPWNGGSDASDPYVIASRKQGAIYWINLLRERAGAADVWASNFADDAAFLQFIIDERARELYHEGYRRTDLIRFGQFTTNKYIWKWKGGTHDGQAVDSKYNIYPIPNTELTANPNLYNENY